MIVQGDDIANALGQPALDSIKEECKIWEADVAKDPPMLIQDDSGI